MAVKNISNSKCRIISRFFKYICTYLYIPTYVLIYKADKIPPVLTGSQEPELSSYLTSCTDYILNYLPTPDMKISFSLEGVYK